VVIRRVSCVEAEYIDRMPPELPPGRYLSATGVARADSGGQTRALLLRSRLISAATGSPVDVLCFDPSRGYDQVRAQWYASGLLSDGMRLLNLFEHYRQFGWGPEPGTGESLPELEGLQSVEKGHPDGSWWQTSYLEPATGQVVLNDYRRQDGSVYLRASPYRTVSESELPRELIRVSPDGEVLGRFSTLSEWYHRWVRELTVDDARTFLFMDSRYLMPIMAPIPDPDVHLVYLLHNCHVPSPRRWSTPPKPDYQRCLEHIGDVDAFVTLTERQRGDIELRWGARTNLDVVSNPVEPPVPPVPTPARDPHRVILLARLERQKRIQHAVLVMERVIRSIPQAHLEVYGAGKRQTTLQELIDRRGLASCVRLHGHDPQARDRLWESTAFLLTSEFEGYPLATLESGCPVVSYDVAYGPREQISDGVDGYLVPDADVAGAANRVVRLLSNPQLAEKMGAAARRSAAGHGEQPFVDAWARVLQAVVERAPRRVRHLSVEHSVRVRAPRPRPWDSSGAAEVVLSGLVRLSADGSADPEAAQLILEAVDPASGDTARVPIDVARADLEFRFTAEVNLQEVFAALTLSEEAALRLRLSWENAGWETMVRFDQQPPVPGVEPAADGSLRLRGPAPEASGRQSGWWRHRPGWLKRRPE